MQKTKLISVFLSPLPDTQGYIPPQTLAVEPRFATVNVAHIEESLVRRILLAAIAFHHQYVALWVEPHGNRIMQHGWRVVRTPVHRIDAHTGLCQYGNHVFHVLHRIIADCHTQVSRIPGCTDMPARQRVIWSITASTTRVRPSKTRMILGETNR